MKIKADKRAKLVRSVFTVVLLKQIERKGFGKTLALIDQYKVYLCYCYSTQTNYSQVNFLKT